MSKEKAKNVVRSLLKDTLLFGGFVLDALSFVFILATPGVSLRFYYSGKTIMSLMSAVYSNQKCNTYTASQTEAKKIGLISNTASSLHNTAQPDKSFDERLKSLLRQKYGLFAAMFTSLAATIAACELLLTSQAQETDAGDELFPRNVFFYAGIVTYAVSNLSSLVVHGLVHHNIRAEMEKVEEYHRDHAAKTKQEFKQLDSDKKELLAKITMLTAHIDSQEKQLNESRGVINNLRTQLEVQQSNVSDDSNCYIEDTIKALFAEMDKLHSFIEKYKEINNTLTIRLEEVQKQKFHPMTPPDDSSDSIETPGRQPRKTTQILPGHQDEELFIV